MSSGSKTCLYVSEGKLWPHIGDSGTVPKVRCRLLARTLDLSIDAEIIRPSTINGTGLWAKNFLDKALSLFHTSLLEVSELMLLIKFLRESSLAFFIISLAHFAGCFDFCFNVFFCFWLSICPFLFYKWSKHSFLIPESYRILQKCSGNILDDCKYLSKLWYFVSQTNVDFKK